MGSRDSSIPDARAGSGADDVECLLAAVAATHHNSFRRIPEVIGIGGVHVYSNCEVTKKSPECDVDRDELQAEIMAHADLTDEQLVEAGRASSLTYASKRITVGALTVGFMKAFGFQRVRSLKINMADSVLVDSAYWR